MTLLLPLDGVKQPVAVPRLGCHAHVYVDTVAIWLTAGQRHNPKFANLVKELYRANHRANLRDKKRVLKEPFSMGTRIWIHQPTAQALQVVQRYGLALYRCHVAIDVALADAPRVTDMLAMKHRGNASQVQTENVRYAKPKYTKPDLLGRVRENPRNLADYGDRESKATGQRCWHLEIRLCGTDVLESHGLENPDTYTQDDFDLHTFLSSQIRVLRPNKKKWERFCKKLAQQLKTDKPRHKYRKLPAIIRQRHPCYHDMRIDDIAQHVMRIWLNCFQRCAAKENEEAPRYQSIEDVPVQVYLDFIRTLPKGMKERLKRLLDMPTDKVTQC